MLMSTPKQYLHIVSRVAQLAFSSHTNLKYFFWYALTMHFLSRTIVFALKIKTLDLFRTNANFMFFIDLGGFRSAVSYRRVRANGEERLTLQRGSCAVHLPSHKRSEALPGPQSPLGCQPFDCYLSIQLVEVGPTITHHPGPGLCLIWLAVKWN